MKAANRTERVAESASADSRVADTALIGDPEDQLDALDRHGFLLVRNALDEKAVNAWRDCLLRKYQNQEHDIDNAVGNVAFNHLLAQEPELARPLIGHASVACYLKAMLGRQCQLRSFRAHMNPKSYTQEWHTDELLSEVVDREAGKSRRRRQKGRERILRVTTNTPTPR